MLSEGRKSNNRQLVQVLCNYTVIIAYLEVDHGVNPGQRMVKDPENSKETNDIVITRRY